MARKKLFNLEYTKERKKLKYLTAELRKVIIQKLQNKAILSLKKQLLDLG